MAAFVGESGPAREDECEEAEQAVVGANEDGEEG